MEIVDVAGRDVHPNDSNVEHHAGLTHTGDHANARHRDHAAMGHGAMDHGANGGHDKHAGHSVAMFRDRFWLSLALSIPVVIFSQMVQDWLGFSVPDFPGDGLIAPVLGTVVFLYGGRVF